ncbi:MAG: transporter substrate-binding domain-containing protein [Propionibacteriaceae bacterium]|jgi:polar amino acid transport system substrate-binding protein|nr:transporter substrate-binding domain-containing protein [Propionibacteriaceae bacterium]
MPTIRSPHSPRVAAATVTVLAALAALGGCGSTQAGDPVTSAPAETVTSAPAVTTEAPTTATGSFRSVADIQAAGSIKIGVFSDKAPFGSVDANGDYTGYDIEYGNRIGQDLGVTVEYVPVEAASRVSFLETGKVDLILANFTVTAERAEKVDFLNPYMKVALGVASPEAAPITDIAQLAGKKVIVVKGTTAETYLAANYPDFDVTKYEQYTEATSALLDGRGDAWVTDNTEALAWTKANPGFTTGITSLGPADTIAGAVQKGNKDLLDWLNAELVTLGAENFFHQDFELTLEPVYGDVVDPDELVVEGGQV